MKITGAQIVHAIANRLDEEDIRCYDSAIIGRLKQLSAQEVAQLATFGDVTAWHNARIKGSASSPLALPAEQQEQKIPKILG